MTRASKAYEYESLDELNSSSASLMASGLVGGHHSLLQNRPGTAIPTSYSGSALNRLLTEDDDFLTRKYLHRRTNPVRRSSDGGMTSVTDYFSTDPSLLPATGHHGRTRYDRSDPRSMLLTRGLSYDLDHRSSGLHQSTLHQQGLGVSTKSILSRKPRSWHPSPYGSDEEFIEEDDILTREAKKQKIKAEIARRRQQIEQNSRLHDELLRLARLRESGDVKCSSSVITPAHLFIVFIAFLDWKVTGGVSSLTGSTSGVHRSGAINSSSSVLRSINDILREDRDLSSGHHHHHHHHHQHRSRSSSGGGGGAHMYDYSASPTRRAGGSGYPAYGSHSRGASPARHGYGGLPSEEERSMERLASTFRTEDYTSSLYERLHDFSPLASDQEMYHHQQQHHQHHQPHYTHHQSQGGHHHPAAMPLLPDMPSRSRKLLEDLASEAPTMHIQSRGKYGAGGGGAGGSGSAAGRYLSPR